LVEVEALDLVVAVDGDEVLLCGVLVDRSWEWGKDVCTLKVSLAL
jgi:hypothetical protein